MESVSFCRASSSSDLASNCCSRSESCRSAMSIFSSLARGPGWAAGGLRHDVPPTPAPRVFYVPRPTSPQKEAHRKGPPGAAGSCRAGSGATHSSCLPSERETRENGPRGRGHAHTTERLSMRLAANPGRCADTPPSREAARWKDHGHEPGLLQEPPTSQCSMGIL